MNFDAYQDQAETTAHYPEEFKVIYPILGLCGEVGEICDKFIDILDRDASHVPREVYEAIDAMRRAGAEAERVKKLIRDGGAKFPDFIGPPYVDLGSDEAVFGLLDETGDLTWYSAALHTDLGREISNTIRRNVSKLTSRAKRGVIGGSGDNR